MNYEGKELKYTDIIVDDAAIMILGEAILGFGADPFTMGINANFFVEEMFFLKDRGLKINIKINSPGGDVFAGWVIADAVRETGATTQAVGIAASMASVVLLFGSERTGNSFASALIHKPKGKNKNFIEMVVGQVSEVLKAKTNFTDDEITEMMSGGKDFLFTADQMLEKGLIDRIEVMTDPIPAEVAALANMSFAGTLENKICIGDICKVYNDLLNYDDKTNNDDMKNLVTVLVAMFGLKVDASENSLIEAVNKLKKDADIDLEKLGEIKAELTVAKDKVTALTESTETAIKDKATALVEAAIEAKKISEDQKENFVKMAIENYPLASDVLGALKADDTHISVESQAGIESGAAGSKGGDKKYEFYVQGTPEALAEWETMIEKEPKKAEAIEKEYQERTKKEIEDAATKN